MKVKLASGIVPNTNNKVFMYQLKDSDEFICSVQSPDEELPRRSLISLDRWDLYVHRWNLTVREAQE